MQSEELPVRLSLCKQVICLLVHWSFVHWYCP